MSKYSVLKELAKDDRAKLNKYSDLIAHLLFHRGIKTNDEADKFINLDFDRDTHDPFLFKDMDKAVSRILEAIKSNEKITIFSDYDADGIPAAVVMNDFFEMIGFDNFDVYIPHRNIEGFGLNKKALKEIKKSGSALVITLDCGITDVEQVDHANELGMDVIITDHHEAPEVLPKAHAIVNPKQTDCKYPEKMLCGSGVAFKLVQALFQKGDFDILKGKEKWLLDMVGVATLSDMVPLTGENRIFAHYGLVVLKKTRRKGINKLFRDLRVQSHLMNETDVVFSLTPRINAASRMDEPKIAFKMLKSKDEIEANKLVGLLHEINDERKGHVALMIKQIKSEIKKRYPNSDPKVIVVGNTNWRPSLLGLAATKIVEEYDVPVLLWGRGEGSDLKGSGRTPGNVNLVSILEKIPKNILDTYGGHKNAGGFVVTLNGVDSLQRVVEDIYKEMEAHVSEEMISVDYQLSLNDVNNTLLKELDLLAPYGMSNEKPLFLFPAVSVEEHKTFGKDGAHSEIFFQDESGTRSGITFYATDEIRKIQKGMKVDLLGVVEFDPFKKVARIRIEKIFKLQE